MNPLTTEQVNALAELLEAGEKMTPGAMLERYDHGGGRAAVFDGDRILVGDFYEKGDREAFWLYYLNRPLLKDIARSILEGPDMLPGCERPIVRKAGMLYPDNLHEYESRCLECPSCLSINKLRKAVEGVG